MPTHRTDTPANVKTVADLRAGDVVLSDGHPIEVTHVQPATGFREPRQLIVYADSTVATLKDSDPVRIATDAEIEQVRAAALRAEKIKDFRALIDWLEDRPDVPLPYQLTIQGSITSLPRAEQVAAAEAFAEAHGTKVHDHTFDGGVAVSVNVEVGRYAKYTLYGQSQTPSEPAPRGTDNGDPAAVVPPGVEGHAHERGQDGFTDIAAAPEPPRLVEPAPQTDPALRPGYDANPTILLAPGQTYQQWYEAYATALDTSNPGWWNDRLDRMAGTLADLARERRAETWGENELDHDRVPTTEGFEAHEEARRAREVDCDDPWHASRGETPPVGVCGGCGAIAGGF